MKRLGIEIDAETHREAKIQAIREGLTLTEYLIKLIREDCDKKRK